MDGFGEDLLACTCFAKMFDGFCPHAEKQEGSIKVGNVIFLDGSTEGMTKTMNQMMGMMKMDDKTAATPKKK